MSSLRHTQIKIRKRGDIKIIEDLQYLCAMGHPGGGRQDIPNRLKRHFFTFNLILPSTQAINEIYGQMLKGIGT